MTGRGHWLGVQQVAVEGLVVRHCGHLPKRLEVGRKVYKIINKNFEDLQYGNRK